jgi:hypothetical protein
MNKNKGLKILISYSSIKPKKCGNFKRGIGIPKNGGK